MHGGWSGGPFGERNGAFKHGRYSEQAKEKRAWVRGMVRAAETMLVTTSHRLGLKPLRAIRRKRHVKRLLAKLKGERSNEGQTTDAPAKGAAAISRLATGS
jgi:hypothetical protein